MPFTSANRAQARDIVARYPRPQPALLPLLHLAQDQDGWVSREAMEEIATLVEMTPAEVLGVCSFYTMYKREPVGRFVVSVCTNVSCLVNGGPELLADLRERYDDDDDVFVEEVECLAACDLAPVLQVNYEFHGPVTPDVAGRVVDEYKRGDRAARGVSGGASPGRVPGAAARA